MNTSLIVIDGVLRKVMGGQPIPEGVRLYRSLATTGQIILLAEDPDSDQVNDWLELHGLVSHVVSWPQTGSTRLDWANRFRREGYDIDLIIEPDPAAAAALIEGGFNVLLFTHAAYTHPSWRPDTNKGVQPWDDITKQVAAAARAKAADARLRDGE